jgi:hypothetical protein
MAAPPYIWLGRHFHATGLSYLNGKVARGPSSDRWQPSNAFGRFAGSGLSTRSARWTPRGLAQAEFGEFWRVPVILVWVWILASRQNLLTNGNTHLLWSFQDMNYSRQESHNRDTVPYAFRLMGEWALVAGH